MNFNVGDNSESEYGKNVSKKFENKEKKSTEAEAKKSSEEGSEKAMKEKLESKKVAKEGGEKFRGDKYGVKNSDDIKARARQELVSTSQLNKVPNSKTIFTISLVHVFLNHIILMVGMR